MLDPNEESAMNEVLNACAQIDADMLKLLHEQDHQLTELLDAIGTIEEFWQDGDDEG